MITSKKLFNVVAITISLFFLNFPAQAAQPVVLKDSKFLFVQGNVMFRSSAQSAWLSASSGQLIPQGSEVKTDDLSSCVLGLGYKYRNAIKISALSNVVITSVMPPKIDVKSGKIFTLVRDLPSGAQFQVNTATAVAAARGTAWVQTLNNVIVFDDTVNVKSSNKQEQDVPAGKSINIDPQGNLSPISDNDGGSDGVEFKDFIYAVQQHPDSEDFVYVRNEKDKASLKLYTRKEMDSYRKSTDKDWYEWLNDNEFVVRINEEYQVTDEEDVLIEDGIVKSIHIVYADLFGPGSHNIVELRVNTRVPVIVDDSGQLYGLKFDMINKYEGFGDARESESEMLPPPLPEVSNESQGQSTSNPTRQNSPLPKSINTWIQVNASGFASPNNTNIPAMTQFKTFMYAGTTNTVDGAKLFRSSNGTTYSDIDLTGVAGFAGTTSLESMTVSPLPETATSRIYIGTARDNSSALPGNVLVSSDGTTFTDLTGAGKWAVANDGANDSPAITALIVYEGNLYAGVSFQRHNCEIWRRPVSNDAVAWTIVVSKADVSSITGDTRDGVINDFSVFNGKIFAAIESTSTFGQGPVMISSSTGDSGSWELSGTRAFA